MVSPEKFFQHVKVSNTISKTELGIRISKLLEQVIRRLPDEEQFTMAGMICINTRAEAMQFWRRAGPQLGTMPNFDIPFDGNCTYAYGEAVSLSIFTITIVVDNLEGRSDDYIIGLLAHELAEMSYTFRKLMENLPSLKKMKPKARQVMMNRITQQSDSIINTEEHQEHENAVNNEAVRLGFEKEIVAMDGDAAF